MATGAPGTNGVWQYGEDDSEATFSALLNKAASTTDTQLGLDRARLTTLEARKLSGLTPIIPSGVTVNAGSGSFNSTTGRVTYSGATTISVNGVFSTAFEQYKIVFGVQAGATQDVFIKLRNGTTDISNDYYGSSAYTSFQNNFANWTTQSAATSAFLVRTGTGRAHGTIEFRPRQLVNGVTSSAQYTFTAYNPAQAATFWGGCNIGATDTTGFTIISTSSALAGTMTVYGYNS